MNCLPKLIISGGELKIETASAGSRGVSGDLLLRTGDVIDKGTRGDAGDVGITTGSSVKGKGGDIVLGVGKSKQVDGGSISLSAGSAAGYSYYGGDLNMKSGESDHHTGEINLITPDSKNGNSGDINIGTGSTKPSSQSGNVFISTGDG